MNNFRVCFLASTILLVAFCASYSFAVESGRWPTYMHDNARSGVSDTQLDPPLKLVWEYRARHAPTPAWPPPAKQDFWHRRYELKARVTYDHAYHVVSDGERVYFGSSTDDKIYALDLKSGRESWSYFTEGPVRLAPTLDGERLIVGSDDGFVYCLQCESGKLLWRVRASSENDRRIPGNERIISVWPVRTGVLVDEQAARFASGLFPTQGAHQFAVDRKSGELLAKGAIRFSPQGYLQQRNGVLSVAQGRSPDAVLAKLQRRGEAKTKETVAAPKDYPFCWIGAGSTRFAGGDGKIAAIDGGTGKLLWSREVDGKAHSLAIAGERLIVSTDAGRIYCFAAGDDDAPVRHEFKRAAFPWSDIAVRRQRTEAARWMVKEAGRDRGYGLLLGDEGMAFALAKNSAFRIVNIQTAPRAIKQARRRIDATGLYGRVTVRGGQQSDGSMTLPDASRIYNLVVVDEPFSIAASEVRRLLRPGGVAMLRLNSATEPRGASGQMADWRRAFAPEEPQVREQADSRWLVTRRPPLVGAGEWTHMYGNPANTACSDDASVRGPLAIQWYGPPGPRAMLDRHHRTTPPLYKDGVMFIPGDQQVFAVDAYNGVVLWNAEVAGFRRVGALRDSGNLAAAPETLYAVAKDRCYGLRAADGARLANFAAPATLAGGARDWGHLAVVGDQLFGGATQPGASRSEHRREQIAETYYDNKPIVVSSSVFCLERKSGQQVWKFESRSALLNPTITFGGGRVYFVESHNTALRSSKTGRAQLSEFLSAGADLVALEQRSGREIWRRKVEFNNIAHHLYLCYAQDKLVATGTRNVRKDKRTTVWYDLYCYHAETGKRIWQASQDQREGAGGSHGEQDHHPAIVGDTVYQEPYAYDLQSGKRREGWSLRRGGHGCGTMAASASAVFYRAGTPTMCDLASGERHKVTQVSRPGCWINMIPAGGLLLIPEASSGCTCNFAIQSSMAFIPVGAR